MSNATNETENDQIYHETEFCRQIGVVDPDLSIGTNGAAFLLSFGLPNFIFYFSVIFIVIKHKSEFTNPFHTCMIGLAVCDLYMMVYLNIYAALCEFVGDRLFGRPVDYLLTSVYYVFNYAAHCFQILYAANRFSGVVLFSRYTRIFKKRNVSLMIAFCFGFGLLSVIFWSRYGFPFLDLESGIPIFRFEDWMLQMTYFNGIFEGLIVTAPAILAQLILYPVAFCFLRARRKSVASNQMEKFSLEVKLLMAGGIQGFLFFVGYTNFYILMCTIPMWAHFQLWQCFVIASPYLYLLFDRKLRAKYVAFYKNSDVTPPSGSKPRGRQQANK